MRDGRGRRRRGRGVTGSPPRVQVRRGRQGLELRVDGTLASSYRPGRPETGPVWDALAAPLVLLPESRRRRILILGLGGGSVARMARALAPTAVIVGVERDATVLDAARRHFDLDLLRIDAVEADAYDYLRGRPGRFDLVIEDLFTGSVRRVRKPGWLPEPGYALAARCVGSRGLLTSNTIHETPAVARALGRLFPSLVSIAVGGHYNHVLAAGRGTFGAALLRRRWAAHPLLRPLLAGLAFTTLVGRGQPRLA